MTQTLSPKFKRSGQFGFTLIELLVTMVVLAILMSVAVPSFQESIRVNQMTNVTQQFQAALMTARSTSVQRGARVSVAPLETGLVPQENWNNGWVVFLDANNDGIWGTNETVVLRQEPLASLLGTYLVTTNAVVPTNRTLGVPSYVAGRPAQLNGALMPFSASIGLSDQAGGGNDSTTLHNRHWRTVCVAVTGRSRVLRQGDPGVTGAGVCPQ